MKMKVYITLLIATISLCSAAQSLPQQPVTTSAEVIEAYSIKAVDKVAEFYNYVELITDPSLSAEMREHTATEAVKLFENPGIKVYDIFSTEGKLIPLKDFIAKCLVQKSKLILTATSAEARVIQPGNTSQVWLVKYNLQIGNTKPISLQQYFTVQLERKKFGDTVKNVRSTYLGNCSIK